jgi:hypothetical protein
MPQILTQEKEGLGGSGRNMHYTRVPFPCLKAGINLGFTLDN